MMNLTNLFCGYKPGRVFELNFFIGPSMNVVKISKDGMHSTIQKR